MPNKHIKNIKNNQKKKKKHRNFKKEKQISKRPIWQNLSKQNQKSVSHLICPIDKWQLAMAFPRGAVAILVILWFYVPLAIHPDCYYDDWLNKIGPLEQ